MTNQIPDEVGRSAKVLSRPWVGWTVVRAIANSRLPQASASIPAIGYAVLWSDEFARWLGSKELLGESVLPLSIEQKLYCLWWGAILMPIGWLIYRWRCPSVIRRCPEAEDYVLEQFQLRDAHLVEGLRVKIRERFLEGKYDLTDKRPLFFGRTPVALNKALGVLASGPAFEPLRSAHTALLLSVEYEFLNQSKRLACWTAFGFLVVGAAVFLTPSVDVGLRVIRQMVW